MFTQKVTDLKLAIVELDGCVLPLNHYRWNFYKNLAKQRHASVSVEEFASHLGNAQTMYDDLPLARVIPSSLIRHRCEKDLYGYLKLKQIKANEGTLELFEYFRQKKIPIAVFSSHSTAAAVEYLKLVGLYAKVDYVIGSDTKIQPLPSSDILTFLMNRYGSKPSSTLVITSMQSLLRVAYRESMTSIFLETLMPATEYEKQLSYKVVGSMFEALNEIIFGQYDDYRMFENVLGMNGLSRDQLRFKKQELLDIYKDDARIMDIVEKTYSVRMEELNKGSHRFVFDDEVEPRIYPQMMPKRSLLKKSRREEQALAEELPDDAPVPTTSDLMAVKEDQEETKSEPVIQDTKAEEIPETDNQNGIVSLSQKESDALMDTIAQIMEEEDAQDTSTPAEKEKTSAGVRVMNVVLMALYALVMAFMFVFVGIIISVVGHDAFTTGALTSVTKAYNTIGSAVDTIFGGLFKTLVQSGTVSQTFARLGELVLALAIILFILEVLISLVVSDEEEDSDLIPLTDV